MPNEIASPSLCPWAYFPWQEIRVCTLKYGAWFSIYQRHTITKTRHRNNHSSQYYFIMATAHYSRSSFILNMPTGIFFNARKRSTHPEGKISIYAQQDRLINFMPLGINCSSEICCLTPCKEYAHGHNCVEAT